MVRGGSSGSSAVDRIVPVGARVSRAPAAARARCGQRLARAALLVAAAAALAACGPIRATRAWLPGPMGGRDSGAAAPAPPAALLAADAGAELSPDLRDRAFDVAWRRVRDGFFDPSFGGVNWDSLGSSYRVRALSTRASVPFHELLAEMLAQLHVSHTAVFSPERLAAERARQPGWTGAEVRHLTEGWVVVRVPRGSPAERAGLRPGDLVDSIAGVAADAIARAGQRAWLSARDSARASTVALEQWLAGTRGGAIVAVVRDTLGQPRTVRMKSASFPGPSVRIGDLPPTRATMQVRRLEGDVGYVRFTAFVPSLEERIRRAIRGLRGTRGLVLDLRGNPGGFDRLGDRIAGMLVQRHTLLTRTRLRRTTRVDEAHPAPDGYRGPVAVLLDGLSASASEQFAAPLQEIGRIVVVGERSAGADLEALVVSLPTGGAMMFPVGEPSTPAGRVIEGLGVTPDVEVHLDRAGLARGQDAQLDAAIRELRARAPVAAP